LTSLALAPDWGYSPFYSVKRPRDAGGRVEIPSGESCHLFVWARKVGPFQGFSRPIVQSDYETAWKAPAAAGTHGMRRSGFAESIRMAWRRLDPAGYWRFSTRRDRVRTRRLNAIERGRFVTPLNI
jgi:hypothetical protein